MITLNAIEQRLREFADNHFFLKSYSFGSPDDVDLDKFQDFPLMHVVYTGSDYDERTKTYGFELYVFDRPNREENITDHQREVVSDAEQCLEDIVADIANGGNIFLFTEDYEVTAATVTPLVDERSNLLSGALLDLSIQVPYQRDACNPPIDGVSPEGGAITYQRRGILRVREQDGAPDVQSVNEIRVTNGTLTDEGNGVVSIDTGGVDTLGDLTDVTITDPLERDALVYDPETAEWINGIPTDIPVINSTGNTHYAGSPLRAVGVQGDKVQAALWAPNQDPKLFIGLASADIAPGATGYCRQIGIVHHLDTSTFEIGDILYPLASTLQIGIKRLGTTPPNHPLARVACAIVLRKHANTGRVFVRTWQPTYDFNDISEVNIATTPDDGQALTFDSATGTWVPGNATPRLLGDISDVQTYDPRLVPAGTILMWNASSQSWDLAPRTSGLPTAYYLGQYDTEAGTGRTAASTASVTVERYLTIQGDGEGESISAQSDTPSSGNKIVRKIWYKANSFEQSDVDTWTLVHTFADDTAYSATEATFEALLNAQTYGTPPFTLAQSWEDVPAFTGLLDTYPGAAAAYSLRLLDSTYTGDAINVRRASDNAVQDIGFDANGDLDTSALATFCAGTDGFVVRWYDQSGNGNDLVRVTTAQQPKIYDATTGVETAPTSGEAMVNWSGAKDLLASGVLTSGNATFAAVAEFGASGQTIIASIIDTFNDGYELYMNGWSVNAVDVSGTSPSANEPRIVSASYDGSTARFRQNSSDYSASVTTSISVSASLNAGSRNSQPATYSFSGYIGCIIVYNNATHALGDLNTALNSTWNIY